MSLVRMVLVICLQEMKDPTLDFVRLGLLGTSIAAKASILLGLLALASIHYTQAPIDN